jgi:hypothetical protein
MQACTLGINRPRTAICTRGSLDIQAPPSVLKRPLGSEFTLLADEPRVIFRHPVPWVSKIKTFSSSARYSKCIASVKLSRQCGSCLKKALQLPITTNAAFAVH